MRLEWRYQLLRMGYAGGHVCVLAVDGDVQKVPCNVEGLPKVLEMVVWFWRYRVWLPPTLLDGQ